MRTPEILTTRFELQQVAKQSNYFAKQNFGHEQPTIHKCYRCFRPILALQFLKEVLEGSMPMLPYFSIPMVDVRDVIEAHLMALTHEKAPGKARGSVHA